MCPGQESNLHASRHTHLKRARLPIPPPGHFLPYMSGKRDSNSRPQPWQGCALPTELFPQMKGAKTSSGMSPNEISFSVCQCFAVQLSCLRLQRYTFFFIQQTFTYSFFEEQSKFLGSTGKSVSAWEFDNNRTNGCPLEVFLPRIGRIGRIPVLWWEI